MRTTRQDLLDRLVSLGIGSTTLDHPAVFTVAEITGIEKQLPGGHTKNLFLKCKKGNIYLVVALNDAAIDLKSLHKRIDAGRLSFGSAELLDELLGVKPGSVTPFALINDTGQRVTVILDEAMMRHDFLNYHPLENTATTNIARDDLLRFIRSCGHEPRIIAVSGAP
jgi:Ala-tRNA(Pro) deacylase